ncbi:hypothetical protein PoB_005006100 [Plakobranchus ocellatus]|uniref:Uncharacterized protein n=1 Tax=Plakobranchus ocellatus TaxID=259542 RepID=A0AAV4BSV9_9GAST|nr:hypothetical protein PoB_005006100 [Plakobranchus ocellatus]
MGFCKCLFVHPFKDRLWYFPATVVNLLFSKLSVFPVTSGGPILSALASVSVRGIGLYPKYGPTLTAFLRLPNTNWDAHTDAFMESWRGKQTQITVLCPQQIALDQ